MEHQHGLTADFKSFSKGLQYYYGGVEVKPLAEMLYNYLGKGNTNHLVTFSEFISFIREF